MSKLNFKKIRNIILQWEILLFRKYEIPTFLILLLFISNMIIFVMFGYFIKDNINKSHNSKINKIIFEIIDFPSDVKLVIKSLLNKEILYPNVLINNFNNLNYFYKDGKIQDGAINDKGYLLLSSFSNQTNVCNVSLIRISDQSVVHEWDNDFNMLKGHFNIDNIHRFRMLHPLLFDNGDLLYSNTDNPLIMIDKYSSLKWIKKEQYHHSKELDSDGNIWACGIMNGKDSLSNFSKIFNFRDDALVKISSEGNIIFKKSIATILYENDFLPTLAANFGIDPVHLNDIQPALMDGEFWKKDDLLISLRNRNMVLLYRPKTNKIIWHKIGPWLNQHDVDFISTHEISIFGNDIILYSENNNPDYDFISDHNNIYIYDFYNDSTYTPYKDILLESKVATPFEGLHNILPNNNVFIEETGNGRLLLLSNDSIIWEFTNRLDDDYLYVLNWSRYIDEESIPKMFKKI